MLRRILIVVVTVMILACLAGCATTKIIVSWKDETAPGRSLKRPLVLAIVPSQVVRGRMEDEFVASLGRLGVAGVASYRYFPDIQAITPDAVRLQMASSGCDGVLVARFRDVTEEVVDHPARTVVYETGFDRSHHQGSFSNYYARSVQVISSPGYSYVARTYRLETAVYSGGEDRLLWSAETETDDTGSVDKVIVDFTRVILEDLRKKQVL